MVWHPAFNILGGGLESFSFVPSGSFYRETKMNTEPERKFGVVAVGVGRAGSVRIWDLRNPHASSEFLNLIGFVSR